MEVPNPLELVVMSRNVDHDRLRDQPQQWATPSKDPHGYVSPIHNCQTTEASKLCIYDANLKLNENGDYHIGGTYSESEPELWFFFTTSMCHGNNHLLNLFVYPRKPGRYSIKVSDSNQLTQKKVPDDQVPHMILPDNLKTDCTVTCIKPNQNYYLKTYCFFSELPLFETSCTLIIPIKIIVNPKFVLNENIVKSIKLQHDLSSLLKKEDKTDFILESATHKQFPTYKILLAAHSPVLRNMIKSSKVTSLFIDISDNDLELLLEFIYTGTIKNIMNQDCLKLFEIAHKFQLTPLFTLTQHAIGDQISIKNAVDIALVSKKYNMEELQKKVFEFIIKNPEVMKTDAWMNLKDVELTKYLFQYMHNMRD